MTILPEIPLSGFLTKGKSIVALMGFKSLDSVRVLK